MQGSADRYKTMAAYSHNRHYTIRMILLGEAGAGKSSLYYRIKFKTFRDDPEDAENAPTGTMSTPFASRGRLYDTHTKNLSIARNTKVTLTMVDTANRERFQSLTAGYYRRANVILMVCSLDKEYTLTKLTKWFAEAQHYKDDTDVIYAVVGMKSDLAENEREVTPDMLNGFAAHCHVSKKYVFEVSAKTGDGVNSMLNVLCTAVVDQYRRTPSAKESTALLYSRESSSPESEELLITPTHTRRRHTKCCCTIL